MKTLPIVVSVAAALLAGSMEPGVLGAQSFAPQRSRHEAVPPAYRPPAGMCRIWLDSVPPNRQPAPTDCASAIRNLPPNARVVFSDSADARREKQDKEKRRKPDTRG
ncbi:MAG: hypothetical protein ACT4R6_12805 [Gemmatimonadaceae bacterium]